jgi:hypothetical protein
MQRRRVLAVGGVTVLGGLSGCLSRLPIIGGGSNNQQGIADKLAITSQTLATAESAGSDSLFAFVRGKAVNTTSEEVPVTIFLCRFYDASGSELASNTTRKKNIAPRETFDFNIGFPVPPSQPRLAEEIEEYKIEIYDDLSGVSVQAGFDGAGTPN